MVKIQVEINKRNRGSTTVELTLVLPIFIIGIITIYNMCMIKLSEITVYEAAIETSEYMAEYAYIDDKLMGVTAAKARQYLDDTCLVDRYIKGGKKGIKIWGLKRKERIWLYVSYDIKLNAPFLEALKSKKFYIIKQRAYQGDVDKKEDTDDLHNTYVYVTDNMEVYHATRGCTHLVLSISADSLEKAKRTGYTPCEFCGDSGGETVYVTDYGERYHFDIRCIGLKRTVRRIKLSETGGIPGCTRCVEN